MFQAASALFDRYLETLDRPAVHAGEVKRLLWQLEYCLDAVRDATAAIPPPRPQITPPPPKPLASELAEAIAREQASSQQATWRVQTYVEAFYLCAWRLREILNYADEFPGFATFGPKGVLMVRNHLIEHPEKHAKAQLLESIAISGDDVHLRLAWTGDDEPNWHDPGLKANAEEFEAALRGVLVAAVEDGS